MKKMIVMILVVVGTLSAVYGKVYNVRDFGAVGDGVADDTIAIQKALNQLNEARKKEALIVGNGQKISWGIWDGPYGEVMFPAGTYKISAPLVVVSGVKLSGEDGAILRAASADQLILYLHYIVRAEIENLTFDGGKNQILFWTGNQDTAGISIRNCKFINSSDYALVATSYAGSDTSDNTKWSGVKPQPPFNLTWNNGMPTLTPAKWPNTWANSTRMVVSNCSFDNCAGMYMGHGDGQIFYDCSFQSTLPQKMAVISAGGLLMISNFTCTAAVIQNAPFGWIDYRGTKMMLRKVRMNSSTTFGMTLVKDVVPFPKQGAYAEYRSLILEDCEAAVSGGANPAMVTTEEREPNQIVIRRSKELNGKPIDAVKIKKVPRNRAGLFAAALSSPVPPMEMTHSFVFEDNDSSLKCTLPSIFKPFLQQGISADSLNKVSMDMTAAPFDLNSRTVLNAEEYGVSDTAGGDDTDALEKLFLEAKKVNNPLIQLPGRQLKISRTLQLPENIALVARGRTFLIGKDQTFPLLAASGNLNIYIRGISFVAGDFGTDFSGSGQVYMDECGMFDNSGIIVERKESGEGALRLTVDNSIFYSTYGIDNRGGEVFMRASWCSILPFMDQDAYFHNDENGKMRLKNILGVPIIFLDNDTFKGWQLGKQIAWIQNQGQLHSQDSRFGGEFGGIPAVLNQGGGKVMLEGAFAYFFNKYSKKHIVWNQDAAGNVVLRDISSLPASSKGSGVIGGVSPELREVSNVLYFDQP